jgi:hypothetical protein
MREALSTSQRPGGAGARRTQRRQSALPVPVLEMQRRVGNQAVAAMLARARPAALLQRMVLPVWGAAKDREAILAQAEAQKTKLNHGLVVDPSGGLKDAVQNLSGIGKQETLWVVGHGSTATVAGKDPAALAAHLVDVLGLPADYTGTINLATCESGKQPEGINASPYAKLFATELAAKRQGAEVDVVGYDGPVILDTAVENVGAPVLIRIVAEREAAASKQDEYEATQAADHEGLDKALKTLFVKRILYSWGKIYEAEGGALTKTWRAGRYAQPESGATPVTAPPESYASVYEQYGFEKFDLPPIQTLVLDDEPKKTGISCVIQ